MNFRVWAPKARSVELHVGSTRLDMRPDELGFFTASLPGPHREVDYGFRLDDDEKPLPDPRSPDQPRGPHGLSRTVDHDAFSWTDQHWRPPPLSSAVIYELHVGTFTPGGTFDSAIERLDDLAQLGVTHLELLPVAEFPGERGWGYDGVSLFAPHHAYGGPDALKRLINAAHQRGLAVLLDVVYNHLGPSGNYLPRFGHYFDPHLKTPWGDAINFSGCHSDEVRRFFLDNALMWLRDYHFDGLRLDAVHAYIDLGAMHFLEELSREVETLGAQVGRKFVLIAESDLNDPRLVRPRDVGGYGLDAHWIDDFRHALHVAITGETTGFLRDFTRLEHLARSLRQAYVYAGRHCPYRQRRHGRPIGDLPGWCFVNFIQNHDQVGNRMKGERLAHLVSPERAKLAAGIVLLAPFVPLLWMGEEWAASSPFLYFTDHTELQLAEAVRAGRRKEFAHHGWDEGEVPDPQDRATFTHSQLKWDERTAPLHRDMLQWYQQLIALRRRHVELTDGRLDAIEVRFDEAQRWLTFQRGRILVMANFADESRVLPLPHHASLLLQNHDAISLQDHALHLPPSGFAVLHTPT